MVASVVRDPAFLEHNPGPGHWERAERLLAIDAALGESEIQLHEIPAREATREELERVHDPRYIAQLLGPEIRGKSVALDPDTSTSPRSVDAAILAAGAAIELASRVAKGEAPPGIALVRPPGHHALSDRAMGFCLLNNVAIAAAALRASGLAERVAIYDFDVHHGNGTEAIFYENPDVLYCSTHQWPFYPGTGDRRSEGRGKGTGATVNVPLPAGTGDAALISVTDQLFEKKLRNFSPDMILLSAGFDPFRDDPIGGFQVTVDGFRTLAERWRSIAETQCDGRIAAILEGGYDLDGLGASVRAFLEAWSR